MEKLHVLCKEGENAPNFDNILWIITFMLDIENKYISLYSRFLAYKYANTID